MGLILLWQLGIVVLCALLGWLLARLVRALFAAPREGSAGVVQLERIEEDGAGSVHHEGNATG